MTSSVPTRGHALTCHPATPARAVRAITASVVGLDAHWLNLRWRVEGTTRLVVPRLAGRTRADGLWKTTCFELFAHGMGAATAYSEFNLSPSERWAAYDFTAYREGNTNRDMPRSPDCTWRHPSHSGIAIFDAVIPRGGLPAFPLHSGIAAVIEEEGGHLSYWALKHAGAKPDFHDAACFTLLISAAESA